MTTAETGSFDRIRRTLASEVPFWNSDEDTTLVCRAVRAETHDVKTFVFASEEPRRFVFDPGQFVTFELKIAAKTVFRSYTIASPPTRPFTLEVTIKRVPGGVVSNWFHDEVAPGSRLEAALPMGDFTFMRHPSQKFLFLSAGSGITPLASMTRTLHDLGDARDVIFVHAARTPADIVFRDELAVLARRAPNLRVVHLCEADAPFEAWSGLRGRLSAEKLREIAPDFADREVFVCGPRPFMEGAAAILLALGHDRLRHHEESFSFEDLAAAAPSAEPSADAESPDTVVVHRVEFARTKRVIECESPLSILEAARRAGVRLPSSCAKGVCGTCKSKVLSGTFVQDPVGGIRPREVAAGMALLCSARPTSDLVVDR